VVAVARMLARKARNASRASASWGPITLALLAALAVLLSSVFLVIGLLPERGTDAWDGGSDRRLAMGRPDDAAALLVAELLALDEELLDDIAAYRRPRRVAATLGLLVAVGVPAAMSVALHSGRARRTLRLARSVPGPALQAALAVAAVVLLTALVRLPLQVWTGVIQDGRWGFRTRSVPGWFLDQLVIVGGRALGLAALVWGVATLMRRDPRGWPARVVLLTALIGPLVLVLHPLVAHPLLLPTGPLPDGPHRDAVLIVLERSTADAPVLVGEASRRTTRRNAVATGLGPTERVVLHDTLLELGPREVAAIAAHELAHLERRDPLRAALAPIPAVALVALLIRRRLRADGGSEVGALASAVALVLALEAAVTPVTAAMSRTVELRTDVRAVAISGDPDAHVALLRAFVVDGLADPDPPRWTVLLWATHPTPTERILAVSGAPDLARR